VRHSSPALATRLVLLYIGLVLFGVSLGLLVRAEVGLPPWDVLHQGIAERVDLALGTVVIIVSMIVLLLWIPLRQRPGLGTISNAIVVGLAIDATLSLVDEIDSLPVRLALLGGGILVNGAATGMYIGAAFGPGPRDGLMTGLAARGRSLRVVRTGIELTVLVVGIALGGSAGLGTIAFAFSIGPLVHYFLPLFGVHEHTPELGEATTVAATE
jgi:uncharacterized membrane protein YczE